MDVSCHRGQTILKTLDMRGEALLEICFLLERKRREGITQGSEVSPRWESCNLPSWMEGRNQKLAMLLAVAFKGEDEQ